MIIVDGAGPGVRIGGYTCIGVFGWGFFVGYPVNCLGEQLLFQCVVVLIMFLTVSPNLVAILCVVLCCGIAVVIIVERALRCLSFFLLDYSFTS